MLPEIAALCADPAIGSDASVSLFLHENFQAITAIIRYQIDPFQEIRSRNI